MNELKAETRALLDLGRGGDDPSDEAIARVRRSLGIKVGAAALGVGAVAGSASKVGASAGAWASTKILLLCGSIAVGGAAIGVLGLRRADPPTIPATRAAPHSAESAAAVAPPVHASDDTTPPPAVPPPPRSPPSERPAGARSIQAELELIRAAQKHLHRNEPGEALAFLTEHARRFPSGVLWEEREASRVSALCQKGDVAAARALAEHFVERSPESPFAERVRASCRSAKP